MNTWVFLVAADGGEVELAGVDESLSASERTVVLKLKELQVQQAHLSFLLQLLLLLSSFPADAFAAAAV